MVSAKYVKDGGRLLLFPFQCERTSDLCWSIFARAFRIARNPQSAGRAPPGISRAAALPQTAQAYGRTARRTALPRSKRIPQISPCRGSAATSAVVRGSCHRSSVRHDRPTSARTHDQVSRRNSFRRVPEAAILKAKQPQETALHGFLNT